MTHFGENHSSTSGDIIPVPITQMIADDDKVELETYNTDPENNLFFNINADCGYYTDGQYNKTIKGDQKLSIIHFNSRSLYANFHNIKEYLGQFSQPFNIMSQLQQGFSFSFVCFLFCHTNSCHFRLCDSLLLALVSAYQGFGSLSAGSLLGSRSLTQIR